MCDDSAHKLGRDVANALRVKRQQLGISQNELSQRCNMSRTGLRAIELGINSPTFVSLYRISKALGVSLGEIVFDLEQLHK
jgi:transcriptional regulator with XRE-family HTH domain